MQKQREQADCADAGEPKANEPQQALRKRSWAGIGGHQ
jgi:hypothetical protein